MHAADLLSKRALLTPDREALLELETGRRYTYAQLNARANRAAHFLRDKLGVQKGDRISLLAHNSVVYLDLFYGLAKIGAILTPLNWRLVARELAYIVKDCQSTVLFCGPDFVNILAEMRPDLPLEHIVSLEGAGIPGAWVYEQEVSAALATEPPRPPRAHGNFHDAPPATEAIDESVDIDFPTAPLHFRQSAKPRQDVDNRS